jgi:methionyl-tRNA formyltransferase
LRVVVITQGVSNVFESIVESGHDVVGIIECASSKELNPFLKAVGGFFTGVYYSLTSNPLNLKIFSKKLKIPYYYLRKEDSENLEKWMKNLQPDLIVVYSMSHLLKETYLISQNLGLLISITHIFRNTEGQLRFSGNIMIVF